MATYAIGDLQGCLDPLKRLLDHLHFEPDRDFIWFTGDLVNRGPHSLETLRFVRGLSNHAITVLGNHDLHLLALGYGYQTAGKNDHLEDILAAPDRDELLYWLRYQPLIYHDDTLGFTMVHAGLPPQWDLSEAIARAHEVQDVLRSDRYGDLLQNMYGNKPDQWSNDLEEMDRLRFSINCFTRLRYCDDSGRLNLKHKGHPGSQPSPLVPWFSVAERASRQLNIIFGHWSTLGPYYADGVYPLDTGCLWGGRLTAMKLQPSPVRFSLPCPQFSPPGSPAL